MDDIRSRKNVASTGLVGTEAGFLDAHFEACRPEYEAMIHSVGIKPGWRGRVLAGHRLDRRVGRFGIWFRSGSRYRERRRATDRNGKLCLPGRCAGGFPA